MSLKESLDFRKIWEQLMILFVELNHSIPLDRFRSSEVKGGSYCSVIRRDISVVAKKNNDTYFAKFGVNRYQKEGLFHATLHSEDNPNGPFLLQFSDYLNQHYFTFLELEINHENIEMIKNGELKKLFSTSLERSIRGRMLSNIKKCTDKNTILEEAYLLLNQLC